MLLTAVFINITKEIRYKQKKYFLAQHWLEIPVRILGFLTSHFKWNVKAAYLQWVWINTRRLPLNISVTDGFKREKLFFHVGSRDFCQLWASELELSYASQLIYQQFTVLSTDWKKEAEQRRKSSLVLFDTILKQRRLKKAKAGEEINGLAKEW